MDFILLCSCLVLLVITVTYFRRQKRTLRLPPGPKGYPFVGNSFDVDVKRMYEKLHEWSKQYGEIFLVNVFGRNLVVLNTGEINREAFLKEPNTTNLADRIPSMVGKDFFYNFHDTGFSGQNKDTIRRRKLVFRLMKAYGEGMKVIERRILEELDAIMQQINENIDDAYDAEFLVEHFVCGVLMTLLTGRRQDYNSELVSSMILFDSQLSFMMNPGVDFLLKWFPLIKRFPCRIAAEYKKTKAAQKKYLDLILQDMKLHPSDKGILHDLFAAKEEETDANGHHWITMDDLFGMLTNISNAAMLTTKGTTLALLHCLIECPEVQKKLQKEADRVIGHERKPSLSDRKSMPYTEAVIMETLRLISHVPLSLPHGALNDTVLRGYDIPKGTTVISNLWAVHHDEDVFVSPFKFDPQRFLDADDELLPFDSEPMKNFMAFGLGKRSCIGEIFARGRLFLFLSTMMQNYTIQEDPDNPVPLFDPRKSIHGLVLMPHTFICKFKRRLH